MSRIEWTGWPICSKTSALKIATGIAWKNLERIFLDVGLSSSKLVGRTACWCHPTPFVKNIHNKPSLKYHMNRNSFSIIRKCWWMMIKTTGGKWETLISSESGSWKIRIIWSSHWKSGRTPTTTTVKNRSWAICEKCKFIGCKKLLSSQSWRIILLNSSMSPYMTLIWPYTYSSSTGNTQTSR